MEISAENIQVQFDKKEILKGVDLVARSGRFIGVVGPNGSGKSTLLKCIYRVLKPTKGAIYLDDVALRNYSAKEAAKKIAVVAQHNLAGFDFTVQEMVLMGRAPHKNALDRDNAHDYQIVDDALKTTGMEAFKERSFSSLSGGEQQRVILARALAQQTPCLILDEPTNHLDIRYQLQLMRIVKESGCTIISAIHDLNIAARYCDEIYVLSKGCIRAHGAPHSVFTKELINEVFGVKATLLREQDEIFIVFRE
ncbi:MAG: ABC transporter ATP-binding protein [Chloroflexi bacterium]|nr:ABC transporter ATP-binding protein [Chloroflexota bacterium]